MSQITIQKPTDQPTGAQRLVNELRAGLRSNEFDTFWMIVAFAKVGPLLRLADEIETWKAQKRSIKAIFGIDQRGTSQQALKFALANFQETRIVHGAAGDFSPTFHPKLYVFLGPNRGAAYIGSNNLTVGGTEVNFESNVKLDLTFPTDDDLRSQLEGCWADALQATTILTPDLLSRLVASNLVLDELQMRRTVAGSAAIRPPSGLPAVSLTGISTKPPSPIPPHRLPDRLSNPVPAPASAATTTPRAPRGPKSAGTQALAIQIIPHHNGEVFLSKRAVNQDPAFFGWPFTGLTVPKRPGNPAYPQRTPDPVVDIHVFDAAGNLRLRHNPFNLNTVYYETKSEIRITVPPDVVQAVPGYSIMVMRQSARPGYDYEIYIYVPGSPQHTVYLTACNQTMPSGGRTTPRSFGWI